MPIDNKYDALLKGGAILVVVLVVLIRLFFALNDRKEVVVGMILIAIISGVRYYYKNNIREAFIYNDNIEILKNGERIEIPFSDVLKIKSGITNRFVGGFNIIYLLYLRRKYSFGYIIYLKYVSPQMQMEDPDEISIIKRFINNSTFN